MNEIIYEVIRFYENAPQIPVLGLNLYLVIAAAVVLMWLLCYILKARALQRLSYDRWLSGGAWAWFPIGFWWVLGNIADDYGQKARGKQQHKRSWLLWLSVAISVVLVCIGLIWGSVLLEIPQLALFPAELYTMVLPSLWAVLAVLLVVRLVIGICALAGIYTSCDPDRSTGYLLFSLLLPITMPFILSACRSRNFGMPPERMAMAIPTTWKPHT